MCFVNEPERSLFLGFQLEFRVPLPCPSRTRPLEQDGHSCTHT